MGCCDNLKEPKSNNQDGCCDVIEEKNKEYVHPRDKTRAQRLKDFIAGCKPMGNGGCGCGS